MSKKFKLILVNSVLIFIFSGIMPAKTINVLKKSFIFTRLEYDLAPSILVSADSLEFGTIPVDSTIKMQMEIRNNSNSDLHIYDSSFSSNNVFRFTFTSKTLKAGDSINVIIQFTPTTNKQYIDSLTIKSDDPINPSYKIQLTGAGTFINQIIPAINSAINDSSVIKIKFNQALNAANITNTMMSVKGVLNGIYTGTLSYNSADYSLTFTPLRKFTVGDEISIIMKGTLITVNNDTVNPITWQYRIKPNAGSGKFINEEKIEIGNDVNGSCIAVDINNDSYPDLVFTGNSSGNVYILKNSADNNFTETTIPIGYGLNGSAASGDLNNDGLVDLVVTSDSYSGGGSIKILRQKNDGSFSLSSVNTNYSTSSVKCADVNGDGLLDIVVLSSYPQPCVLVYYNLGNMNFKLGQQLNFSQACKDINVNDYDNDGDMDIIVSSNDMYIIENINNKGFALPKIIGQNIGPANLISGDFDNDGYIDIAYMNGYGSGSIGFLKNDGGLKFSSKGSFPVASAVSFAVADFNNDGLLDLFVPSNGNIYTCLVNKGNFNFQSNYVNLSSSWSRAAGAADFDNDGDIDFAYMNGGNTLVIGKNRNNAASISLLSTFHDFNTCKPDSIKTTSFKIYNDGAQQPLQITNITSSNNVFSIFPKTGTINPGDTLSFAIQFKPDKSVFYNDSITIFSNDIQNPNEKFYVKGRGDEIIYTYPKVYSSTASDTTPIFIEFGFELDKSTLSDSTLIVTGSFSGRHKSQILSYDQTSNTLQFISLNPFHKGERVDVELTSGIKPSNLLNRITPYSYSFKILPKSSSSIFRLKKTIQVSDGPSMVEAKDIDNDGDLDLIVLSHDSGKLQIFRNDGNWNFTKVVDMDAGFGPSSFLTCDYDGDGKIDIVITNESSSLIFLKNTGNFNFIKSTLSVPGYLQILSQGDYDGDGDIDIAAGSPLSIIRNNGDFKFSVLSYNQYSTDHMISEDFDNDGDVDLALANNGAEFLRNDSTFKFTILYNDSFLSPPQGGWAIWDYDNDGDLDFADCSGRGEAQIDKNQGDFNFTPININSGASFQKVTAEDFDGDGLVDLCYCNSNTAVIYKNYGNMIFGAVDTIVVPYQMWSLASGDLDNDGDNDLVFASINSNVVTLYENRDNFGEIALSDSFYNFGAVELDSMKSHSLSVINKGNIQLNIDSIITSNKVLSVIPSSGVIQPGDTMKISVTFSPKDFKIYSDSILIYNSDQDYPIVKYHIAGKVRQNLIASVYPTQNMININPDTISVNFIEDISPTSINENTIKVYGSLSGLDTCTLLYDSPTKVLKIISRRRFITGELISVIVTNKIQLQNSIPVLNSFEWSFRIGVKAGLAKFTKMNDITVGSYPRYLCCGDLDGDGLSDLVISNTSSNSISILKSIYGKGLVFAKNINTIDPPSDIICQDIDGDGRVDIAFCTSNSLHILKNTGNLNFINYSVPVASEIEFLTAGDYNGDGNIDIAAYSYSTQTMQILINEGNFKFTQYKIIGDFGNVLQLISGDFNNDGYIDILCATESNHNLILLRNDGQMNFNVQYPGNSSGYISTMVADDFNSDGRIDIAIQNGGSNTASILINDGNLIFHNEAQLGIGYAPLCLTGGDFNADGNIDLASVNNGYSNTGSIYLNDTSVFKQVSQFPIIPGSQNIVNSDFNGDGSVDLAFVNEGSSSISWLLNTGEKSYALSTNYLYFKDATIENKEDSSIILTNTGEKQIIIDSIYTLSKNFSASINNYIIPSNDSLIISISFKPDSIGSFNDTLNILSDASSNNVIILHGKGVNPSDISNSGKAIPSKYQIFQNYPNPFNPTTIINYSVPKTSLVTIKLYDVLGREIETLVNEEKKPGSYSVQLSAVSSQLSSGVYFYKMEAGGFSETKKLILMK